MTSSHFPQFDRNPNTGAKFGTSAKVKVAQQTIYHDAERPSHILLPVIPAEEAMNRRTFIYNVSLGTLHLAMADLAFAQAGSALKSLKIDVQAPDMPRTPLGMPGLFPGRVIETFHERAVVNRRVSQRSGARRWSRAA